MQARDILKVKQINKKKYIIKAPHVSTKCLMSAVPAAAKIELVPSLETGIFTVLSQNMSQNPVHINYVCIFDRLTWFPSMDSIPLATSIRQKLENSPAEEVEK